LDSTKYLNIKNLDYKVNTDEFIIIDSALTHEYLNSLEHGFIQNEYLRHINYDNAYPIITQKYDNLVNLEDQYLAKQNGQRELIYNARDIIGNDRIIWKRIFPKQSKEFVFQTHMSGAFSLISFILEDYIKQYKESSTKGVKSPFIGLLENGGVSVYDIKRLLLNAYGNLNVEYRDKVFWVLSKQGKLTMMGDVIMGKVGFDTLISGEDYYLSDMDIWVLAYMYKLPIIMFNPNGLKGFGITGGDTGSGAGKLTWLKMGGQIREKFYFVRSLLDSTPNKVSAYNLIYPSVEISKLGEFDTIFRNANNTNSEYQNNIIKLDDYLEFN